MVDAERPASPATPLAPHRLVAYNTALDSDNKIHDDAVAAKFGFTGGLVPGVDNYAYLTQPLLRHWGESFLQRGEIELALAAPIYDGDDVEVQADVDGEDVVEVRAITEAGVRATAVARLIAQPVPPTPLPERPRPAAEDRPHASPESLPAGASLGSFSLRCSSDEAARYLQDVRDPDSPTSDWGVVHPGWILRRANEALTRNVVLPPWIHVGSVVRHFQPLPVGEEITVVSVVTDNFEKKGHRFVRLDVQLLCDGEVGAAIDHTAIYRPRQLA